MRLLLASCLLATARASSAHLDVFAGGGTAVSHSEEQQGSSVALFTSRILLNQPQHRLLLRQRRQLASSYDSAPLNPQGQIAWFCFVAVCVVTPLVCCVLGCAIKIHRKQEEESRAEQEEQATTAISRIEANVKLFSEKEDQRRMQSIRRTMKRHLFVVQKEDLCEFSETASTTNVPAAAGEVKTSASDLRKELLSGCSICLEPFVVGNTFMRSIDVEECRHVFHEHCVCEWLVKQSTSVCPCCRQQFTFIATPSLGVREQPKEEFETDEEAIFPSKPDETAV